MDLVPCRTRLTRQPSTPSDEILRSAQDDTQIDFFTASSNDTGGVIACFKAGGEEKKLVAEAMPTYAAGRAGSGWHPARFFHGLFQE